MKHRYFIYFDVTKSHHLRAIKALLDSYPTIAFNAAAETAVSDDGGAIKALYEKAKHQGFCCSRSITTYYDREDALSGSLGILEAGSDTDGQEGRYPKDAFDFSTGCPRCGLGAAVVKPQVLKKKAIQYKKGNALSGHMGRFMIRAHIGHEIIQATGQPWCMRHPVTNDGAVVQEWLEPVPCATMPPLSRESRGVWWDQSSSSCLPGEPPASIPLCTACGRTIWAFSHEEPVRLVYPSSVIEAAQQHAVLAMYEPWDAFTIFDPVRRTFDDIAMLPMLLFNKKAVAVLAKYLDLENVRAPWYIQPVFAEDASGTSEASPASGRSIETITKAVPRRGRRA